MRENGNVSVGRIKVELWIKVGMYEQTLCEWVVSILPECYVGIDIMPDQWTLNSTQYCKTKLVDEVQMEVTVGK